MKFFKIYIFILVISLGLCAFNAVDAIRINFLNNNQHSLQPVPINPQPNVFENMNFNANQTKVGPNQILPNSEKNNSGSAALVKKNTSQKNYLTWLLVFFIFIVFAAAFILYFMRRKR